MTRRSGWTLRPRLVCALIGAALLGCAEGTGPTVDVPATPHFAKWNAANGSPQFTAVGQSPFGELDIFDPPFRAVSIDPTLDRYAVSFWGVRGQEREVYIKYLAPNGTWQTYIEFEVTAPIKRPDGSTIAVGDSILITISVDPVDFVVQLEPSGIHFDPNRPTELEFHYEGADPDFNGDGVVDDEDEYIERELLGVWYQEGVINPWGVIDSDHDLEDKEFELELEQFSGYAVSW